MYWSEDTHEDADITELSIFSREYVAGVWSEAVVFDPETADHVPVRRDPGPSPSLTRVGFAGLGTPPESCCDKDEEETGKPPNTTATNGHIQYDQNVIMRKFVGSLGS